MKRGSSLRRHVRLARVSAKVTRARPEFEAVYRQVDERSGGRCEVMLERAFAIGVTCGCGRTPLHLTVDPEIHPDRHREALLHLNILRCTARAVDHHHLRKPRRLHHLPPLIVHLCRRHHEMTTASYRAGRLEIQLVPGEPASFVGQVVQKASKWAP